MGDMNVLWAYFLNCAGSVVIGFGLLLVALAAVSLFLSCFDHKTQSKPPRLPDKQALGDPTILVLGIPSSVMSLDIPPVR
jgi:hypothetical protein